MLLVFLCLLLVCSMELDTTTSFEVAVETAIERCLNLNIFIYDQVWYKSDRHTFAHHLLTPTSIFF